MYDNANNLRYRRGSFACAKDLREICMGDFQWGHQTQMGRLKLVIFDYIQAISQKRCKIATLVY